MSSYSTPLDLFAGIIVGDLTAAVDWYTSLFGAEPRFRPDDSEAVWTLDDHRFVYLKTGQGTPGSSLVTILVDDLTISSSRQRTAGDARRPEEYEGGVRKAVFHDPDGNEFGVGSVPHAQR